MTEFQQKWIEPKWRAGWQKAVMRNFLLLGLVVSLFVTVCLQHRTIEKMKTSALVTFMQDGSGNFSLSTPDGDIECGRMNPNSFSWEHTFEHHNREQ